MAGDLIELCPLFDSGADAEPSPKRPRPTELVSDESGSECTRVAQVPRLPDSVAAKVEQPSAKRSRGPLMMVSPFAALMLNAVSFYPGDLTKVVEALRDGALRGEARGATDRAAAELSASPAPACPAALAGACPGCTICKTRLECQGKAAAQAPESAAAPAAAPAPKPALSPLVHAAGAAGVCSLAGSSPAVSSMPRALLSHRDGRWDADEITRLQEALREYGKLWPAVALTVRSRDSEQCRYFVRDRRNFEWGTIPEKMTFGHLEQSLCGISSESDLDALIGKIVWHRSRGGPGSPPYTMGLMQGVSELSMLVAYDDGDMHWEPACTVEALILHNEKIQWTNCAQLGEMAVGNRARCKWDDGTYEGTVTEIKHELSAVVARHATTFPRRIETSFVPIGDILVSRKHLD